MPRSAELSRLLAAPPHAHVDAQGRPYSWGLAPAVLELLDATVGPGSHTLETGSGVSTALLALKGARHDCVVPFVEESDRLLAWGEREGVSFEAVTFHLGFSDQVLPAMEPEPLDVVVVDGGHGFPMPFLDWWYAGRRVRPGGLVVVDDTHLWTGRVLAGFLAAQDDWERVLRLPMRSAAFRRTGTPARADEWVDQPYVRARSFASGPRGLVRRAARGADVARRRLGG